MQLNAAKVFVSPSVGCYPVIWANCQQASVHQAVLVATAGSGEVETDAGVVASSPLTAQRVVFRSSGQCADYTEDQGVRLAG